MTHVAAYLAMVVTFLAVDVVGLTQLIRPVFERYIGDLLLASPRMGAAAVFYMAYIAAVLWFVVVPAMKADASPGSVFLQAALLGAFAYGTYEFTNFATLKQWTWQMVAVDLSWGAFLTGLTGTVGFVVARTVAGNG